MERALKKRPQIRAVLDNALAHGWEGEQLIVTFEKGSIWPEMFEEKRPILAEALSQELGNPVKVVVRQEKRDAPRAEGGAAPVPSSDPVVQQAIEVLNARVQEVKRPNERSE